MAPEKEEQAYNVQHFSQGQNGTTHIGVHFCTDVCTFSIRFNMFWYDRRQLLLKPALVFTLSLICSLPSVR